MRGYRVQRGVAVFGAAGASETVSLASYATPARAFARLTNVQHGGTGRDVTDTVLLNNEDMGATLTDWDGSSFTIQRSVAAEAVDHRFYWEVWEDQTPTQAKDGWYVRGQLEKTLDFGESDELTAAVDVDDWTRCIPFITGVRNSLASREWGQACVTVEMTSSGAVRVRRDPAGTASRTTVSIAVVEFGEAWTITNNLEDTITGNGGDVLSLAGAGSEPWANKFFVPSLRVSDGADAINATAYLASPLSGDNDTIRIRSDASRTAIITLPVMVCHVAYHPLMKVEHQDSDQDSLTAFTGDTGTVALTQATPESMTGLVATTAGAGGIGYPGGHWGYNLDSATSVGFRRGRTGPNTVAYSIQAIRLPVVSQPRAMGPVIGNAVTASSVGHAVTATAFGSGG